jgi:hypothetical protein
MRGVWPGVRPGVWVGACLLAGCDDLTREWRGTCTWDAGRTAQVTLRLEPAPEDGPLGVGTGTWREGDDTLAGDVAWSSDGEAVAVDLLPPRKSKASAVFFRGRLTEAGAIVGTCGDRKPEVLNLGGLFDCIGSFGFDCGGVDDWEPTGESIAPVERSELKGRLTLE